MFPIFRPSIILIILLLIGNIRAQNHYVRIFDPFQGQESAKAIALLGDSIYVRANYVGNHDTIINSIIGIYSILGNRFINIEKFPTVQGGEKNVVFNNNDLNVLSQESTLNQSVSLSSFNKTTLQLINTTFLRLDSSKYFYYTVGSAIKFSNRIIVSAKMLDSTNFVNLPGWFNYQEKTVLFVLNDAYQVDTTLVISPSGAFMKIEDMAVGPDSVLYISFYEKYLKHGSSEDYLEDRKLVLGLDKEFNIVFQWYSPDFDLLASATCLTIGNDTSIYLNYYKNYHTYITSLNKNGSLNWQCLIDSSAGINLYNIERIITTKNGDIVGVGVISSAQDELGESGFLFRINKHGDLLWKKVIRINKGYDLSLPPNFPFQSALEDVVEVQNGDLIAMGFVRKYNENHINGGEYNYDMLVLRTNSQGCISHNCPYIEDIIVRDAYIPIVTSLNEWVVDGTDSSNPINRYTFDPDSVLINNKFYHKLIYSKTIQAQWEETGRFLREENGIVFELNVEDSTEDLLYDFNFQPGDTLPDHNDGSYNHREILSVMDTTLLDQVTRKSLRVSCNSDEVPNDTTIWIEGLGDVEYLFWSKTFCSNHDDSLLNTKIRCFLINKLVLYSRPELEGCYLTGIDNPKIESIIIFPNPTSDNIYFEFGNEQSFKRINIFNNLGQLVLSAKDLNSGNTLNLESLNEGIYFGTIIFQNGRTRYFKFWLK